MTAMTPSTPPSRTLFAAQGLVKRFHSLLATDHVDISVASNEIHALIGPNGAGKSTLVNLISGLLPVDAGRLVLDGQDITHLAAHQRVRAGLSRSFQVTSLFKDASTLDNLRLAVQANCGKNPECTAGSHLHSNSNANFNPFSQRDRDPALTEVARQLGARAGLADDALLALPAASLPHAAQRQLDIALALAARPKVLLLDEPLAGMGPDESANVVALIRELRRDMAILLIEHDMQAVFTLADRISVLVYGKVIASGSADDIRANPQVQQVYLGQEP